jgi:hypothetical protein
VRIHPWIAADVPSILSSGMSAITSAVAYVRRFSLPSIDRSNGNSYPFSIERGIRSASAAWAKV